jgi:hypothetical protein
MAFSYTINEIPLGKATIVHGVLTDVADTAGSALKFDGHGKVDAIFTTCSNAARSFSVTLADDTATVTAATNADDGYYWGLVDFQDAITDGQVYIMPLGNKKLSVGYSASTLSAGSTIDTGLTKVEYVGAQNMSDVAMVRCALSATAGSIVLYPDTNTDAVMWFAIGD